MMNLEERMNLVSALLNRGIKLPQSAFDKLWENAPVICSRVLLRNSQIRSQISRSGSCSTLSGCSPIATT